MIYVYYVPGSFGSTIEYVLRSFTNENTPVDAEISDDGSMHGFDKFMHLFDNLSYIDFFNNRDNVDCKIITPVYPSAHGMLLPEMLSIANQYVLNSDKLVLIYISSEDYLELNQLFQYHKIINGSVYNRGLSEFVFGNSTKNITQWNPQYRTISNMQPWEFREWQSLSDYSHLLDAPNQVTDNFLKVTTEEILNNTNETFEKIISWCGLTRNANSLENFVSKWKEKQLYVLDEQKLIINIVNATINNISMPIPKDLNIIAQAMIQKRLRKAGYELQCDGLNDFPDNTTMLHKLLDSNLKLHTKDL